jgi:RNAse (barnase) inhibitor barstar
VPTLLLDGARWKTADDFYNAFLEAVGAPPWHGRNFNALRDSIAGGDINAVGLLYGIVVLGTSRMSEPALAIVERFRELIAHRADRAWLGHDLNVGLGAFGITRGAVRLTELTH